MGALLREEFWTVVLLLADIGDAVEGVAGSQSLFDEDLKSIRLGKKSKASFFKSEKSNPLNIISLLISKVFWPGTFLK